MAVRLADVAAAAGVSQASASRVLNGSVRRPQPEVAARVRAAAKELGYFPNAQAQALARSSASLMGLIVHDIADPYFSSIARGAQRGLAGSGVQLMLASTEREAGAEAEAIRTFMSYRTDAVLLVGSRGFDSDEQLGEAVNTYRKNGGRFAMIGQPLPSAGGVQVDNEGGAAALAESLLRNGYRRFFILSGGEHIITAAERMTGFSAKLKAAGLTAESVSHGAFSRDGGYLMMSELIASGALRPIDGGPGIDVAPEKPCVFCVSDVMALGAIAAVRAAGWSVPEDVAIAGFDDIPTLADQHPTITTVRLPLEAIGRAGAEMLLHNGEVDRRLVIEGAPVIRASTPPR